MRRLCVLVALALALLFGGAATEIRAEGDAKCPLCAGALSLACPTCAGKGRGRVPCDICDGKGRARCPFRFEAADRAGRKALVRLRHENSQTECPNGWCLRGSIPWEDGKPTRCGLCAGTGKVRCLDCVSAQSACAACSGSGKMIGPCVDCNGTGKVFCVLCRGEESKCSQCGGETPPACTVCQGKAAVVQACAACGARGRAPCTACDGVGRAPCKECDCGGRLKLVLVKDGTPAQSSRCPACDGKGSFVCFQGADGRMKCALCAGDKRVVQPCRACGAKGTIECRACGTWGFRAAEAQAAFLDRPDAKAEEKAAAIELYEFALRRASASADAAWKTVDKDPPPKASAEKAPPPGADVAALREYLRRRIAVIAKEIEASARWAASLSTPERLDSAVERCEKALEKLRAAK